MRYHKITLIVKVEGKFDVGETQQGADLDQFFCETVFEAPGLSLEHEWSEPLPEFTEDDMSVLSWCTATMDTITYGDGAVRRAARKLAVETIVNRMKITDKEADHVLSNMCSDEE